ncbi:tRNA pseudouridine synthase A [Nostocoides japonicum T1-X7]|uniref:tRNA pseudouridine synthase A n=1 Tax=Nostocoides japonicum T1-X7 TaxID=1194083 RepID=A0A077M486_9MICO|nr:tRNA pseudouridine synthase A [Tetrasphaera japonica T1-X7]
MPSASTAGMPPIPSGSTGPAGPETAYPTGPVVRIRLDLGYDGTDFSGWAAQPGRRTVEGELTAALGTVLRLAEPPRLVVAGRTDAGVHARGQVVHVDVPVEAWQRVPGRSERPPERALVVRLRSVLAPDLVVHRATVAPPGFDARFAATSRRYAYRICDEPAALDPLRRHDTVVLDGPLDVVRMTGAATDLLGLRDFAAFCRRREGATTVRTLVAYTWSRDADGIVVGTVVADAFCHSMVRALVGAVVPVGLGRAPIDFPAAVLAARTRDPRVKVMPAHGLCLEEVTYPPDDELADRVRTARAVRTPPST